ncbi:hypothetical protein JTE90_002638 [Oedothorax gibbosus]|uniref:Latrophilin Cirl n=1 Tax=Oedothorax gibbosus TaxID=931172 RepID=A0AAV6VII2_9ARAC|nr:hypothetical protein JTE90_002638 [Oedothorax gibbosus]
MEVGLLLGLLLSVVTARRPDYRTSYACEGGQLHISCEEGHLIHLLRANYGRFSISICNEHGSLDWSVDCASQRSYYIIYERCNLMSNCIVSATSETFADPCPGTYKYLEVQYQCKLESFSTTSSSSSVLASTTTTVSRTTTTTTTTRPPIIIPITRSTQSTIPSTSSNTYSTTFVKRNYTTTPSTTTYSPIVFLLPSDKSFIAKSSTALSVFNKDKYCQPIQSRNLSWDWTRSGTEAVQKCPAGTSGDARWQCALDPVRWMPNGPDLSECSSLWVDNLRNRVDSGDSVVNIAAELSVMTHRKPLYGGDVKHACEILHRLVNKMRDKMTDIADDKQRHQILQELFMSSSIVANNLLEVSLSWNELDLGERKNIASTLLEAIEQSGWLLASAHKSTFTIHKALDNLILSVQVLNVWTVSHVSFPSVGEVNDTSSRFAKDFLHLPMQALLGTATNGMVKIVLASYHNIKDFLGSVATYKLGILQNSSFIVNSKIISAYIGRYPGLRFPEPITITFKLIQEENVTNPQCVSWDLDERLWSQDGCWLKRSNKTHATCQCDHLRNFAVLMELKSTQVHTQDWLAVKMFIYISCGVSVVLFLITSILLHFFRSMPSDRAAVHKHLSICLMLAEIVYLGGVDQVGFTCSVLAGILHFLLQAVFVWLFSSTLQLYFLLEKSTYNNRISCYSVVAYSVSTIIVCVSAFVDPESFGTPQYCFLRIDNYYVFSFIGPAASCILGAFIFLLVIICKTFASSSTKNKESVEISSIRMHNRETWFVILCVTSCWSFLLLYIHYKLQALAYTFATLNCLQGLSIFIFLGLHDSEVQEAYQKWKMGSSEPKAVRGQFSLTNTSVSHCMNTSYLHNSTTVPSLSTVTTPAIEFQMGTFHHSSLCPTTRSPIYDNREQLVS